MLPTTSMIPLIQKVDSFEPTVLETSEVFVSLIGLLIES